MKKAFLICPVAKVTSKEKGLLDAYITAMESKGYKVHFPHRDTNQDDPTGGYDICKTNFKAIMEADEIHVWYNESSGGTKFDLGGVFMLIAMLGYKKRVVFVNEVEDNSKKSFYKVFKHLIAVQEGES